MKKFLTKKITALSFGIFLYQLIALPAKIWAAVPIGNKYSPLEPNALPGITATSGGQLGTFLSQAFEFGLAVAGALAVVEIVWGGVEVMLSESVFSKDEGKKRIQNAIWGLLLAIVAWLILYTINPNILDWTSIVK